MAFDPSTIRRPDPSLLVYYFLVALPTLFAFPFVFIPLWVKYVTLQYKIDDEGVSMAWGFLFRREILLTYRRIQDIHVRRNIVHRWLGLSAVAIQTASARRVGGFSPRSSLRSKTTANRSSPLANTRCPDDVTRPKVAPGISIRSSPVRRSRSRSSESGRRVRLRT